MADIAYAKEIAGQGSTSLARRSDLANSATGDVTEDFSVQEAHRIVADLFKPNPTIYWVDFLVSTAVGYGAAAVYFAAPLLSLQQSVAFVVAGLALFRAGVFIHEIVHMPRGRFPVFQAVWNIVYGVPMLTPSFMYKNHIDHHNWRHYGTHRDGEYVPLGAGPLREILLYLAQVPMLPLFAVFRFLVLAPMSLLHPSLRRWVLERASSYVCNPRYRRELPPNERRGLWLVYELSCFALIAGLLGLMIAGIIPWMMLLEIYLLGAYAAGLNWIRNLAAHRYRNTGGEMNYVEQLSDSINVTGNPIATGLMFPVGLRYHALHHLFPSLPYHALGKAHRRLMAELPADSAYCQTIEPSFLAVVAGLWRTAASFGRSSRVPAA